MLTTVIFIAILGLLIFIHELGHFLAAKRAGVRVEEFAFGFKPRLFAKTVGETTYAINLIPLGGYVKMYGEDETEAGPRSYRSKTIFQRFTILIAGVLMNFLLGWLIMTILFIVGFSPLFPGVGSNPFISSTKQITIQDIAKGSPADLAGLKSGDTILKVDDSPIAVDQEFIMAINSRAGESVNITFFHENSPDKTETISVIPRVNPPAGQGALGVTIRSLGEVRATPLEAIPAGLYESGRIFIASAVGFVTFVSDLVSKQRVSEQVTGLIGVGALTDATRKLGIDYLAQLVGLVSIGLATINLMPILPLDGGHLAALLYEKVMGRPLTERQLGGLATVGLAFVILVFVVVTYKDVLRFGLVNRFF